MSRISIRQLIAVTIGSFLIAMPLPALAAANPDAQSAAAGGIHYLSGQQQSNGSISGFSGVSDWSAEAVEASGQKASVFTQGGASLLDFLKTETPTSTSSATAIERKIIAIAATGASITDFGGVNYDTRLTSQHTGGQIGDPTLLNDDIFGVIAIDAAHATQMRSMAQDGLDYLLAHQSADGGFSYTTDTCAWCGSDNNDTAAALVAIYAAEHLGLVPSDLAVNLTAAKTRALTYLLNTQSTDGGFSYDGFSSSDGSSTAWSLMALNTIGSSVSAQALLARNWLIQNQNSDGGFSYAAYGSTDSDTSTTAHAVIALLGSTWLLRPASTGAVVSQPQPAVITQPSSPSPTGSTSGNSSPNNSQTNNPTAAATTSGSDPASATLTQPDDTTGNTTRVDAESTTDQPENKFNDPAAIKTDKTHTSYAVYSVALLGIVAFIWFVLESRQSKRSRTYAG